MFYITTKDKAMPRGGYRPGAGGSSVLRPLASDTPELAAAKRKASITKLTPLAYMLQVINDEALDVNLRLRAAACAAPYVHARKQETGVGKKERDQETAKEAAVGKYLPPEAPGVYSSSVN